MAKSNPYEVQLVGEVVDGRYRVERLLGHGGMGTVWLAIDERVDGRRVVVKVPRASFLEQEGFLDRFEREIQSLTRLDHPRIVKVLDVAHLKGVPVVVLQYLAGGSLAERTERPMTPADVVQWITPVAEGLDFIHSQGVIHRDVKPGNILFDSYGNAFLADFGIAKALGGEETGLTSTGASPGSPSYMAPEAGSPDALGPNYDQYSLACVVYKALSGRLPHEGRTALEVILKRTVDPPVPLRQAAPQVNPAVEAVVMRALARRPGDRFSSCRSFAAEFAGAVTGVPPVNPPTDFTTAETRVLSKATAEPARVGGGPSPTPTISPTMTPTPGVEPVAAAGATPTPVARPKSRRIVVAAVVLVAGVAGVLAWNHFHEPRPSPGPVPDAEQRFTFDPAFLAEGGATDRRELVVRGTVSPPATPEVDVGLLGDLRRVVQVGAGGAIEATVELPAEDGPAVVVVWTALRREMARRSFEVDRTPPRVSAKPKEARACGSDEKTFVVAVDASEPVELFEEATRRSLARVGAGASEVALDLPAAAGADPVAKTFKLRARDRVALESKLEFAVEVFDFAARARRLGERRPAAPAGLDTLRGAELSAACAAFDRAAQEWEREVSADAPIGARRQELLEAADWKALRARVNGRRDDSNRITVTIVAPAEAAVVSTTEVALRATVDPPGATVRVAVERSPPREFTAGADGVLAAKFALPDRDGSYGIDVTRTTGERLARVNVVLDRTIAVKVAPIWTPGGNEPIDRSKVDRARVRFEFAEAVRAVVVDAAGAPLGGAAPVDFPDGKGELDVPFPPTASVEAVSFAVALRVEDRLGNRVDLPHPYRLFDGKGQQPKSLEENTKRVAGWAEVLSNAPTDADIADADVRRRIADVGYPWLVRDRQTGIDLLLVPSGSFEMGSKEKNRKDETPHPVEIPDAFYIGRYEVTQEQWQKIAGANPSAFQDDPRLPVENVSHDEVRGDFLSKTGLRLPTEAEWEYVARGASKSSYPWGDTITAERANCRDRAAASDSGRPLKVGSFPKGATWCGALDVSGNVLEWCWDWYDDKYYTRTRPLNAKVDVDPTGPRQELKDRVARGGSWFYFDDDARCSRRMHFPPGERSNDLGFRAARTIEK